MSPIDFGGDMIFPNSYGRDEFSAAEEAQHEAEQEKAEQAEADIRGARVPAWTWTPCIPPATEIRPGKPEDGLAPF